MTKKRPNPYLAMIEAEIDTANRFLLERQMALDATRAHRDALVEMRDRMAAEDARAPRRKRASVVKVAAE